MTQNGKLQKEINVQSQEMKELCAANGALKENTQEQHTKLLKDTDLQINEVRKFVRD